MSFRMLPKDPKFFELFIADGENLRGGRERPSTRWSTQYDRLEERVAEHPGAREARRRDRRGGHPPARGRVRHPVRPRGHPRARVAARRRRRRHPGDRRDVRHLRRRRSRPPRRGGWRRSSTARAASSPRRSGKLDGLKDLERHLDGDPRAREGGRRPVAGGHGAPLPRRLHDPIEVIKWRDLYNDLEDTIDAAEDAAEAIERMYHKAN